MRYTQNTMRRYMVVYEKTLSGYGAFSPDLPGCIANGHTLDEARALMVDAMGAHLEVLKAEGLPVPDGRPAEETAAGAEIVDVG